MFEICPDLIETIGLYPNASNFTQNISETF